MKLKNIDPEDIEALLETIANSFQIRFTQEDINTVRTFGDLCDLIDSKILLKDVDDCTTQQAFNKLKTTMVNELGLLEEHIQTDSLLTELLPKATRNNDLAVIQQALGLKLSVLWPGKVISNTLISLLVASFICLYYDTAVGVIGVITYMIGMEVAYIQPKAFRLNTVGELVEQMVMTNYIRCRRDPGTYNSSEIYSTLVNLFHKGLGVDRAELTRDAKFI